jgi:hypothetical protein
MSEHDPLCRVIDDPDPSASVPPCDECDLIARVRENERGGWEPWNNEVSYDAGYSAGRADAARDVAKLFAKAAAEGWRIVPEAARVAAARGGTDE